MKTFAPIALDARMLAQELDELENFLRGGARRKEREHIAPFFKARRHLVAGFGLLNADIETPDRHACELSLFGDFTCDAASGDSETNAYTLVEFEDAQPLSIFGRLPEGRTMKPWSPRFKHGFSQLVDWAWRLSSEGKRSTAFERVFGATDASIHLLLIAGRSADLQDGDHDRLRWRSRQVSLGEYRMACFTYDGILDTLRRRILVASQPGA